jgi:hypothetical protein
MSSWHARKHWKILFFNSSRSLFFMLGCLLSWSLAFCSQSSLSSLESWLYSFRPSWYHASWFFRLLSLNLSTCSLQWFEANRWCGVYFLRANSLLSITQPRSISTCPFFSEIIFSCVVDTFC